MTYTTHYSSPLGKIILVSNGTALTELDFAEDVSAASATRTQKDLPVFEEVSRWLDAYFAGRDPGALPPLAPHGTAFQQAVWKVLRGIPYGTTTTYGRIAARIAAARGGRMSAQAVGGAVGRNPISIIIPCHRVIGADGSLTGYAGGLDKKEYLLRLEGVL
ncbi:methylated-DNA--[protein]-cysteine S-methyltransferase [uncultured Selenomonas sp.]|uniref:methylated-DNA--[protein]-cysteine S-methyltransferase n=1 Tax=uncultured Selenomonas sp. TaxID=159275 RepID=UPI002675E4DD|nr:methylated-DNA--[protein]-cysteine S-methyltransferase [uncultured Selenomonas sp.]